MSAPVTSRDAGRADLVFGMLGLVLFTAAALRTAEWEFRTALFPRMVAVTGIALTMSFVVVTVVRLWRPSRAGGSATRHAPDPAPSARDAPGPAPSAGDAPERDADERDHEVEYAFATAGRRAWTQALAWVAVFLCLLFAGGLFVAAAGFALTYLRWAAGRSWLFAAGYAAVIAAVLYLSLQVVLAVPVPGGVLR